MLRRAIFAGVVLTRALVIIATLGLLNACAPVGMQQLTQTAADSFRSRLSAYFVHELDKSAGNLLAQLSTAGGFLSDPRVRILLPPPLGMVMGVTTQLVQNPEAALLEVLLNQAAEQAIPAASPILRQAITSITPARARQLISGEPDAVSDFLRDQTEKALRDALLPSVASSLADTDAPQVYASILESHLPDADVLDSMTIDGAPLPKPPVDLAGYVTDQAIDGVFKVLAEREEMLRRSIESMTPNLNPPASPATQP